MDTRTKIMAVTRENDTAGKFQADLTPVETISGKELAERWAEYSHQNAAQAQATLTMLEGFILENLPRERKSISNLCRSTQDCLVRFPAAIRRQKPKDSSCAAR